MYLKIPNKAPRPGFASTRRTDEIIDALKQCGIVHTGLAEDWQSGIIMVRVRVMEALVGGGKYSGYIRNFPAKVINKTSNLGEDDLGINGPPCYIINPAERGLATHDLTETPQQTRDFVGHILPQFLESKPWIELTGYDFLSCA